LWELVKKDYLQAKQNLLKIIDQIDSSKVENFYRRSQVERGKGLLAQYFSIPDDFSEKGMIFFIFERVKRTDEGYLSASTLINLIEDLRKSKIKLPKKTLCHLEGIVFLFWKIMEEIEHIIFDDHNLPDNSQKQEKIILSLKKVSS